MDAHSGETLAQPSAPKNCPNQEGNGKRSESSGTGVRDMLEMPLMEHLRELRSRIIWSAVAILLASIGCFSFSETIFALLTEPYYLYFPPESLIGTGPAEAFVLRLKVAFFAGILIASPIIFLQVWLFVAPGLYPHEKKYVVPFIIISTGLFLLGSYLCYQTILPLSFAFFVEQYRTVAVTPQIRVSEHLSLTLRLLIAAGAMFEAPVLSFFLTRMEVITHKTLLKGTKMAIVGAFLLSGIITPTADMLTQTLFALPLMTLYAISVGVSWAARPRAVESGLEGSTGRGPEGTRQV